MKVEKIGFAILALFVAVAVQVAPFTFVLFSSTGPFPITTDVAPSQKGNGEYHFGWYFDGRARVAQNGEEFYIDLNGKRIN